MNCPRVITKDDSEKKFNLQKVYFISFLVTPMAIKMEREEPFY